MKETWMVCDSREAAVCSWLSSRAWYLEHSQLQQLLLQLCGPVQLDTAQGKWWIWDTTEVDGVCILVKYDMLDIQQLLPQLLTCSAKINPKRLFGGEWNKILLPEQQQRSHMHQWLVGTVAVTSTRGPVGSGPKLGYKKLSKLSATP